MVLKAYNAPVMQYAVAALSNWIFLAGFVIFPSTFISLGRAAILGESQAGRVIQGNIPLLMIGILCYLAGGIGIGWAAWRSRRNYMWLIDRILIPGLLNSIVALLMSLVNIYTAQYGSWSTTAIVTVCVTGA
ncbi:unnamed protein product [Fusarium graminearum]|uniref:Uncharacterized protein n=1 Tax=Gibberella zeae TaxID=5518 RepID=A0A9N8RRL9_GIBZA|nr:unnamed protein product [Fusarium graminearum]